MVWYLVHSFQQDTNVELRGNKEIEIVEISYKNYCLIPKLFHCLNFVLFFGNSGLFIPDGRKSGRILVLQKSYE